MVNDIQEHLAIIPFVPFRIRTADGREYRVPTRDHIYLPPKQSRVIVANDKGYVSVLSALLISGINFLGEPATPEQSPNA